RVRLRNFTAPPNMKTIEEELELLQKEKTSAAAEQQYERAAQLRDNEKLLKEQLEQMRLDWDKQRLRNEAKVMPDDVAEIVSSWTRIPVKKLREEDSQRLLKLEEILHQRVVGQDEAVKAVARAIRRARAGIKKVNRPIGSFFFLGPTGVGKTELARALAEAMFGDEEAIIRIDMSEYSERHTISRLVGSPPGYVGYEEGGQLTEAVRRRPYSVILFDEMEKAHPEVFNVLLQLLEDGRLTDGKGRTVNFCNSVIIMTSNVGADIIRKGGAFGFGSAGADKQSNSEYESMKTKVLDILKNSIRPEFLNRIDDVIVFHQLGVEHIKIIVDIMLNELSKLLAEIGLNLQVSESAKELLAQDGYDPFLGARPLRRAIQRKIEDEVADRMLMGVFTNGDVVLVDVEEGKLTFAKG
ncbi:MAG: AAA family ATPase, partial [bacterium]|nr:AAA family ATPase [bacterium]